MLADEAAALNRRWTFAMAHRRPFVTWKFAATLDGRSAASDGTRAGSPGRARARRPPAARRGRRRAGRRRNRTGSTTRASRSATTATAAREQPRRAVMGLRSCPRPLRVLDDSAAETVQLRTRDPADGARAAVLLGSRHAWLEGGPTLAAAFIRAGLVDRVVAYSRPDAARLGRTAVADLGITTIGDALRLELDDVTALGGDPGVDGPDQTLGPQATRKR